MTKTVLIVEDDIVIAMDLIDQAEAQGFIPIGPCTSVAVALEALENQDCDAAVLDVNLGTETSVPVAVQLQSLGVPYVVVSGYSLEQMPDGFGDAPRLAKPLRDKELWAHLVD